jgi:hypothetical protein
MNIKGLFVIVLLCTLVITATCGCLGGKTTPESATPPPGVLVDYHRTGGIAGFDDRLVIFDNGAAVVSSRLVNREITLNQTDLDRIMTSFTTAQFSMLEGNYSARHDSADLIQYSITYRGKQVNSEDSATPPSLQPVIDELNRIIRSGGAFEQPGHPFAGGYP